MEYKSCFILMPFTKANDLSKDDLNYIYSHILKKAVEEFEVEGKQYFRLVERYSSKVGSIINGIVNNLNTADLVIADLTGLNPNVMYELGVRHSLKRGTIIVSQDLNNLPSDLRDYLTVEYGYSQKTTDQARNYEIFRTELSKTITELISTNKFDSPVLGYLEQKQRFRDENSVDKLRENVIITKTILSEYKEIQDLVSTILAKGFESINESLVFKLFNLKFNNLTTALNELNIVDSSTILYGNIVNSKTLLAEINKMFSVNELMEGLKNLDGFPPGLYGLTDLNGCLQRKFVDLFNLVENGTIKHVTLEDVFQKDGIFQTQFVNYLLQYIEKKATELGVEHQQLETV